MVGETYRVITTRLRVQRGPGRPDMVVERPQDTRRTKYLDSAEKPTLITFDEYCQIDLPFLLQIGAIVPWVAPAVSAGGRLAGGKTAS